MSRRNLVVLLALLVVAASGLTTWLALEGPVHAQSARPLVRDGVYVPADLPAPAGPALKAAVEVVPHALSFDHADGRVGVRAAQVGMTPEFGRRFRTTFAAAALPQIRAQDAVTLGVVRAAGVVRTDGDDRVLCLVYVDQLLLEGTSVTRGDRPETLSRSRVLVDVVRRDGVWLVDGIRPF